MTLPIDRMVDEARHALGAGAIGRVEELCQALLLRAPGDARVWAMLSETALRRNRPKTALTCARRAVSLDARDAINHIMHAKCLVLADDHAGALAAAKAAARYADNPAARDALGAVFSILGDTARARSWFEKAVSEEPSRLQYLFNLAAAERMLGRLEAAEAHCDRLLDIAPHFYPAYGLRADLRTQSPSRNHVAEIERLLAGGLPHAAAEIMLRFAVAKELDDLGRYGLAFQHLAAGSAAQRRLTPHRPGETIAMINRIIAAEAARPLTPPHPGFDGDAPIFVVGLPRSGTTLVERTLAGHKQIVSAGELGTLPRLIASAESDHSRVLGEAYSQRVRARGIPAGMRFIDKFPDNYLHCGAIHRALPRAKIVVVVRDPLDSCLALYRTLFAGTYPFSYDLTELADHYAAFRRLVSYWLEILPPTVITQVAYEDMVLDHTRESRRLIDFLGLDWQETVLNFTASEAPCATASAVQIRQPLYRSSIGKWRQYVAELAPLRRQLNLPD